MTNEQTLATTSAKYENLLERISSTWKTAEQANLLRYHIVGGLFAEFCRGVDNKKYGMRTIDTLAADLEKRGVLTETSEVSRFLYWAKNLYDAYPKDKLNDLSEKGFTIAHAKKLFSLDEPVRLEIEREMVVANKVISSRALGELVDKRNRQQVLTSANEVVQLVSESVPEVKSGKDVKPKDTDKSDKKESEAKPTKAETPAKVEKEIKAEKVSKEIPSPLKTIKGADSCITKLLGQIPDLFIVIKHMEQQGFDSEVALQRFRSAVSDLKAGMISLKEPIDAIIKQADEYLGD